MFVVVVDVVVIEVYDNMDPEKVNVSNTPLNLKSLDIANSP